jgi:hypothetical protein
MPRGPRRKPPHHRPKPPAADAADGHLDEPVFPPVTDDERRRIERFETAYNRVDREFMRIAGETPEGRKRSFTSLVRSVASRRPALRPLEEFLFEVGRLRNAIVHGRYDGQGALAIPTEGTVRKLEQVDTLLAAPHRLLPRFARPVLRLDAGRSLADALELVRTSGFARFPVYRDDAFLGLLTANGITRFVAAQDLRDGCTGDLRTVTVGEVLERDHRRDLVRFLPEYASLDDAIHAFVSDRRLDCVIVTQDGSAHRPPLTLITSRDLFNGHPGPE